MTHLSPTKKLSHHRGSSIAQSAVQLLVKLPSNGGGTAEVNNVAFSEAIFRSEIQWERESLLTLLDIESVVLKCSGRY